MFYPGKRLLNLFQTNKMEAACVVLHKTNKKSYPEMTVTINSLLVKKDLCTHRQILRVL